MRFDAFSYVYLLGLLPLLLALYAYGFWRRRRSLAAFVERPLAARLLPRINGTRRWLKALCVVAAAMCLVVALMQPQWGETEEDVPRRGRDLVVVLDTSLSMLAEDAAPNRLEYAKSMVRELVEAVRAEGGHRLGLVTFAGRATLQSPLTLDYGLFLERLAQADPARVSIKGTLIGDALRQTLRSFGRLEPGYTDLLLITDGDDHGSLPTHAARLLADRGIALYVVGVGNPDGAPVPLDDGNGRQTYLMYDGFEVLTRMRTDLLADMALRAEGVYLAADDGRDALARLYATRIDDLPRRQLDAESRLVAAQRFQWFIAAALVLLGAGDGVARTHGGGRVSRAPAPWSRLAERRAAGPAALVGTGRRRLPGGRGRAMRSTWPASTRPRSANTRSPRSFSRMSPKSRSIRATPGTAASTTTRRSTIISRRWIRPIHTSPAGSSTTWGSSSTSRRSTPCRPSRTR